MIADLIQGSEEWLQARCGSVGASRIADVMCKTRTGYGAGRVNLMAEKISERLTGNPANSYINGAMQHGIDTEPMAREAYALDQYVDVVEVGLYRHPAIAGTHASPDGLVGDDGMAEIKCPATATHINTLLTGTIADRYIKQMQWQMECTGRAWCDFVSFDPRMPDELQLFVKRIDRDDVLLKKIVGEVVKFLSELGEKEQKLRDIYQKERAGSK